MRILQYLYPSQVRFFSFAVILIAMLSACSNGTSGSSASNDGGPWVHSSIPTLPWLTELSGSNLASGQTVGSNSGLGTCYGTAVDAGGYVYCAAHTPGNAGEANGGGLDAVVVKLDPAGKVIWTTQLGAVTHALGGDNSGEEYVTGVAVDSSGNVFCSGYTSGNFGEIHGGGQKDAFILKLDPNGTLLWVTQLGAITHAPGGNSSGEDICSGVAVDSNGNSFCGGYTIGGLGEPNASVSYGPRDIFVFKLNPSGVLQWVTQLGANTHAPGGDNSGSDYCFGIAVDSSGNAFCGGVTGGGSIGEAFAAAYSDDSVVVKINSNGVLQWVTQLGAITHAQGGDNSSDDGCNSVAVDSAGNVFCGGYTNGDLKEPNGAGAYISDAFVMKLNSSGTLQWITQLGANTKAFTGGNAGIDQCSGVATDQNGNVYCSGGTDGILGEENGGSYDAFVVKMNSAGILQWATQLGANTLPSEHDNTGTEFCTSVAVDSVGNSYCGGAREYGFVMKLNSSGKSN